MTYIRTIGTLALAALLPGCMTAAEQTAAAPAAPAAPVAAAAAPAALGKLVAEAQAHRQSEMANQVGSPKTLPV